MASQESIWPAEREPSHQDVEVATVQPEWELLSKFRRALLSSPEASKAQNLMHLDLQDHVDGQEKFTYPAAFLLNCPPLPPTSEIAYLRQVFSESCSAHLMISLLPLPPLSREQVVPPLRLAMACLASLHLGRNDAESRHLFLASLSLWGAMLEIDNREARSPEMLMGATLAAIYGVLGAQKWVHDHASLLISCSLTAARRMRGHDHRIGTRPDWNASSSSNASIWCLWLASIIQALHCDVPFNSFSSRELWARMPSSTYDFQDIYRTLLEGNKDAALPPDLVSPNDAFVLLLAILSDCLCLQQSLGQIAANAPATAKQNMRNPFSPLSERTELARMRSVLSSALDRWHAVFGVAVASEILALFHYCRLHLSCFQLLELPRLAGYKLVSSSRSAAPGPSITSESVSQAWRVLDDAAAGHKASSSQSLCPAWLPIIVFHAGLVLWARQKYGNDDENHAHGSTKILHLFRMELEQMTWPCCKGMAATLDRLINDPSLGRG